MASSLLPAFVDKSWRGFITSERLEMLEEIALKMGENINPCRERVLRFLSIDLSGVRVVILGQDPYPQQGMATGRAFEVGGLESWCRSFRQVSLKNIVRLLHKNYRNITSYEEIYPFHLIQQEISQAEFPILPPDRLFASWEKQGVLLLNTSFSCVPGIPGSHKVLWSNFSNQLLEYISSGKELHWFLWGKNAAEKKASIQKGIFHISRHPMLCSSKYEDDFLKSDCFLQTHHLIHWLGKGS